MKIASTAVTLESSHLLATRHETSESLRSWRGSQRPDFEGAQRGRLVPPPPPPPQISEAAEAKAIAEARDAADNDPFLLLLRTMIEWFTGEPMHVFDATDIAADPPAATGEQAPAAERPAGFGIEYDYHAVHEELERTGFAAHGVVRTADGKEIAFRLELTMSRHFREETSVSVRAGDARRKDPLVINFAGNAAQLSNQRFRFDLDADGRAEDVALLAGGSGYLTLDLNGNGRVDSGAELFGPASGSGFADLAKYDEDRNGWIDEADGVFERLRVWTPAAESTGTLDSLAARGVGALHLGYAATAFELRGSGNENLGAVRDTGIYLTESGTVGLLQEIDLTL